MTTISLPQKPKYVEIDKDSGKFEILGCYPGYGTTLGNAMRRILLSSLEGSAITSVKIKGVSHEFDTIPGVMEDVIQIIMNLKKVRFKMHSDEPVKISLKSKGEGKVTAKDIKCSSNIEVVNIEQEIVTITDKKTELEMDMEVKKGLGYIPVEQQERESKEIGVIAIDAIYTPVRRVNYNVENMRVGKRTDYDKVTLEVITDGSISPQEAFTMASQILVDQFSALLKITTGEDLKEEEVEEKKKPVQDKSIEKEAVEIDAQETEITELKSLSTRTLNVLEANNIKKIKDIIKLNEDDVKELEGMGSKGVKEIKKAIGDFGLTLKSHE